MKVQKLLTLVFCSIIVFSSCKSDDDNTKTCNDGYFENQAGECINQEELLGEILIDATNNVILQTYEDLKNNSNQLNIAVANLIEDRTLQNLDIARQAWVAARAPWEQSEGFLFGPVDSEGLDPAIDSWPINKADLGTILNGNTEINENFVNSLEGTFKGFHAIEYLLWDESIDLLSPQTSDRVFDYLLAATFILKNDATTLYNLWNVAYKTNVLEAGSTNSVYPSKKAAIEELIDGLIVIADEVANGKIGDPLSQNNPSLEESQFSHNSKKDFADNIRSIQNIYVGKNGVGLSYLIKELNSTVDNNIINEIQNGIEAIQNIPGTFTDAIPTTSNSHKSALSAQAKIRLILELLEQDIKPLISNL